MDLLIRRACALGAALFCSTVAVAAAQNAPSPAPTTLPEIGHVVTSDRQDEPLDATARTTYVVTKAEIVRHGYATIADALAAVPGVVIEHYGPTGALANVSIRGTATNGVLVLLDGRPVSGSQIGAVDLGALSTTGIERIEVVEGSGATLYGSGAEGGVVNLITSRTRAAYAVPLVTLSDGSLGERSLTFENSLFSFERRIATNAYNYPVLGGAPAGARTNSDLQSTALRASTTTTLGSIQLSGSAGATLRRLGVPGSTAFLTANARQSDQSEDARVSAAFARGRAVTTLDLSATRSTLTFADANAAEGGPFLDFSTEARVQASLRNVVTANGDHLVYGVDVAHGVARNDGGNGFFSATPFAQSAVYGQDSIQLGRFVRAYAGLRAERDGAAGAAMNPSLGTVLQLGGGTLRLNAATAFRVPTAEDLTFPGFSNPTLVPEHTRTLDATLGAAGFLGGASLGWFGQTGTNLIALNPAVNFNAPFGPGNQPVVNDQQSSVAGFTFDVATKPRNGAVARVNVTDLYRALAYNPGVPATRLPDRPVLSVTTDLGYTGSPNGPLAALGVVTHVGSARADANGTTDTYARIDAYLRLRLAPQTLLSLRGFNLGNARYADIPGYPAPGPGFAVEVSNK